MKDYLKYLKNGYISTIRFFSWLAYRSSSSGAVIPANSVLIFTIDLFTVQG